MSGYIKLRKDITDDPRLLELAEHYEEWLVHRLEPQDLNGDAIGDASRNALRGALVTLWCYADTHIRDDDTLPLGVGALSRILGLPSEIMLKFPKDWLSVEPDGGVKLPGYREKNGLITREKRKELARERTRKWREKIANGDAIGDASRTQQRHAAYPSPYPNPSPSPEGKTLRSSSSQSLPSSSSEGVQGENRTIEKARIRKAAVANVVAADAGRRRMP